jgi:hypothetical protein
MCKQAATVAIFREEKFTLLEIIGPKLFSTIFQKFFNLP